MPDIPSPLTYGTVVGTFAAVVGDTDDSDAPDIVYLGGSVTFTPAVAVAVAAETTPPLTLVRQTVVCPLVDGVLHGPDNEVGVHLLASDSPGVNPTGVLWRASFALELVTSQPPAFYFELPGGSTLDLATLVPISEQPGVVIQVSEATRIAAEAAAAAAAQSAIDAANAAGGSGASAYEIAVLNGFVGDEAAWLASLEGADGWVPLVLGPTDPVPTGTPAGTIIYRTP